MRSLRVAALIGLLASTAGAGVVGNWIEANRPPARPGVAVMSRRVLPTTAYLPMSVLFAPQGTFAAVSYPYMNTPPLMIDFKGGYRTIKPELTFEKQAVFMADYGTIVAVEGPRPTGVAPKNDQPNGPLPPRPGDPRRVGQAGDALALTITRMDQSAPQRSVLLRGVPAAQVTPLGNDRLLVYLPPQPGNARPDGRPVSETRVYDLDGNRIATLDGGDRFPVGILAEGMIASDNGARFATFDTASRVACFDQAGKLLPVPAVRLDRATRWVAVSPDGRTLTAGDKAWLLRHDLVSGASSLAPQLPGATVRGMAYTPDGGMYAVADETIFRVAPKPKALARVEAPGFYPRLTIAPDGAAAYLGDPTRDGPTPRFADLLTGVVAPPSFGLLATVTGVTIDPDARAAYSIDGGGAIVRWDLKKSIPTHGGRYTESGPARGLAFLDGRVEFYGAYEGRVEFDPQTLVRRSWRTTLPSDWAMYEVRMTAGKAVATPKNDAQFLRLDLKTQAVDGPFEVGGNNRFKLSPDGQTVMATDNARVRLFDAGTGKPLWERPATMNDPDGPAWFAADGRVLFRRGELTLQERQQRTANRQGFAYGGETDVIGLDARTGGPAAPPTLIEQLPYQVSGTAAFSFFAGERGLFLIDADGRPLLDLKIADAGMVRAIAWARDGGRGVVWTERTVLAVDLPKLLAESNEIKLAPDVRVLIKALDEAAPGVRAVAAARLVAHPDAVTEAANALVAAGQSPATADTRRRLAQLSDADRVTRETAHRELEAHIADARPLLPAAYQSATGETRERLASLCRLADVDPNAPAPDARRRSGLRTALRWIDTDASRKLAEELDG